MIWKIKSSRPALIFLPPAEMPVLVSTSARMVFLYYFSSGCSSCEMLHMKMPYKNKLNQIRETTKVISSLSSH